MERILDLPLYFSPSGLRAFHEMVEISFPERIDWTARFNASHVPTLRFEDYMEKKSFMSGSLFMSYDEFKKENLIYSRKFLE